MNTEKPQIEQDLEEDYGTSGRFTEQRQLPEGMVEVYQLKLSLEGSKPAIWRRLWVPACISLANLHAVIQIAMDWDGGHLHQFIALTRKVGPPVYFSDPSMVDDWDCLDEAKARLDALLIEPKDKLRYEYDFGDSWMHSLVLEKILVQPIEEAALPRCVSGKRACPPDDTGGVGGWEYSRKVLADPSHPDYKLYSQMFHRDFDPEALDLQAINTALRHSFAPKPKRSKAPKRA
ncbi:MAG: plasmid pRiA4b ORF-3 family protein [Cyanobacteriota bacterium]